MAKTKSPDLFDRLHAAGLRKKVASGVADALGQTSKAPSRSAKVATDAAANLRRLADEIEQRAGVGRHSKRSAAARKAAATRKRNAAKRSSTAKKAARTRASGRSS